AARRVEVRPQEFDLLRVFVDSRVATRAMVLRDEGPMRESNRGPLPLRNSQPPENLNANRMLALGLDAPSPNASQRFSLGFDRDQEECVFSADLEGQIPVIGYNNIRRQTVLKKFHPLDISLRIGSRPSSRLLTACCRLCRSRRLTASPSNGSRCCRPPVKCWNRILR